MKKYTDILRLLLGLIRGTEKIERIEERTTESLDIYDENSPICIPPEIYKGICKELKTKRIKFMGIS